MNLPDCFHIKNGKKLIALIIAGLLATGGTIAINTDIFECRLSLPGTGSPDEPVNPTKLED